MARLSAEANKIPARAGALWRREQHAFRIADARTYLSKLADVIGNRFRRNSTQVFGIFRHKPLPGRDRDLGGDIVPSDAFQSAGSHLSHALFDETQLRSTKVIEKRAGSLSVLGRRAIGKLLGGRNPIAQRRMGVVRPSFFLLQASRKTLGNRGGNLGHCQKAEEAINNTNMYDPITMAIAEIAKNAMEGRRRISTLGKDI